ncbi:MAG: cytidylate kinase [Acidobacteria bacterium RIFCSPLOWO2_12_FULL_54_10]|nr:MAG: cytidylate kinase [Acidobacteria bacterium RIFCSPLOWO2_12_FULL_54_10]
MQRRLVIAIDGPSGAGKSTVARSVAQRLGYRFVESGAMYRAVALLALRNKTSLEDDRALAKLAETAAMRFEQKDGVNYLFLNGEDVTEAIRSPEVTDASSIVSTHQEVRNHLVKSQQEMGSEGGVVMEGRDIGTRVFPNAELKIFLTGSAEVRASRRYREMDGKIATASEEVLRDMAERDRRDQQRKVSPLVAAEDAIMIDTTNLTADEVVEKIIVLAGMRAQ